MLAAASHGATVTSAPVSPELPAGASALPSPDLLGIPTGPETLPDFSSAAGPRPMSIDPSPAGGWLARDRLAEPVLAPAALAPAEVAAPAPRVSSRRQLSPTRLALLAAGATLAVVGVILFVMWRRYLAITAFDACTENDADDGAASARPVS
jgi:hypothetical protein